MAEVNEETRANVHAAAVEATENLIYTVIFDTCNEAISAGADQEVQLKAANSTIQRYIDGGVKVRKRPVARPKAPKTPAKPKPIDALAAAAKKINNLAGRVSWVHHPDDERYSYTTDIKLATGYPVRDNTSHLVCQVATDEGGSPLTVADAKVALSYGLEVDYDSIPQ